MRAFSLLFLLFSGCLLHGQKLLLCTSYDKDGNYTGDYSSWEIKKDGNFMYVLYKSPTPIQDSVFLNLEKTFSRKDTNYYQYDHYYLVPDTSKKWAVNKYVFTKPGNYRLSVYDRHTQKWLQSYTTTISYGADEYKGMQLTDTWYYNQSKILFCESIDTTGKLIGARDTFKLDPLRENLTMYIEQTDKRPLKSYHLLLKIFSGDTHTLLKSFSFDIKEDWFWTYLPVYVKDKGKYTVELYNEDDVFINARDLLIR